HQLLASKTPDELVQQATKEFKDLPSTEEAKEVWLRDLERNDPAKFERFMQLDTIYRQKQDAPYTEQVQQQPVEQPQPIEQPQPVQYQQPAQPQQPSAPPMLTSHIAKVEGALLVRDQLDQLARAEFSDIRSVQDLQTLAKLNPQRATRLLQLAG